MDLEKYRKIFTQESMKYLEQTDRILVRLLSDMSSRELWTEVHGKMHSIKGMAKAMSLPNIAQLGHSLESWCLLFQKGDREAAQEAVQVVIDGTALLKNLVHRMDSVDSAEFRERYHNLMERLSQDPSNGKKEVLLPPPESTEISVVEVEPIDQVRIPYTQIEELLGYSREILMLETTLPPIPPEHSSIKGWVDHYTAMIKGLYFRLAQLRLMSIEEFASIFRTTIDHQAKTLGKQVFLEVVGGDIRADIALLERLREPLLHLIRNAIAHGIEMPEDRVEKGKPEKGRITLKAERDKESLIIRIQDDGNGIDRKAIHRYLNRKFGMSDAEILDMSERKFYETILNSDFSASPGVDQMSGRGIGMSVVARAIEYLSGTLSVESVPDVGVTFMVQLPVSLSVIYAVVFQVGPYLLSIPTSSLESVDVLDPGYTCPTESCLNLRELFRISGSPEEPAHVLKIHPVSRFLAEGHQLTGLVENLIVDRVIGNKPVMIMQVVRLVARTRLFSGIGVLENGMISLLLDIPGLFSALSKT